MSSKHRLYHQKKKTDEKLDRGPQNTSQKAKEFNSGDSDATCGLFFYTFVKLWLIQVTYRVM